MIEVKNLVKYYGKNKVLDGTTFTVAENEIFGILGPNGAGKTTTLECIEGLRKYSEGEITVAGKDPQTASKQGEIGIQLQSASLPLGICAKDAMELFCKWNNVKPAYDLLEKFGLGEIKRKPYKQLSTGQKRRLHLALALAHNPKILFLDEPTAGLDVQARVKLHEEIRKLKQQGVTIILASHDMAEVETLCDKVAIMVKGRIKKIGTPQEIVLEVRKETVISIKLYEEADFSGIENLYCENLGNGNYKLKTDKLLDTLSEILEYLKNKKLEVLDLSIDKPTLEERFIEIANGEE